MLQAVATLGSSIVFGLALVTILANARDNWAAMLDALGLKAAPEPLKPLPPRFRVLSARRATMVRLAPPARVRAAF